MSPPPLPDWLSLRFEDKDPVFFLLLVLCNEENAWLLSPYTVRSSRIEPVWKKQYAVPVIIVSNSFDTTLVDLLSD